MHNVTSNLSRFRGWAKRLAGSVIGHRRTEVTVENHQVLVIRRLGSTRAWCPQCGTEMDMVRPEQLQTLVAARQAQLDDGVLARAWHVTQDDDGRPLVCLESVLKAGL
jgi:hypothetical protein